MRLKYLIVFEDVTAQCCPERPSAAQRCDASGVAGVRQLQSAPELHALHMPLRTRAVPARLRPQGTRVVHE